MSEILDHDLYLDVSQTADALGKVAKDESTFRLLVESFRAQDYEEFRELLTRFGLLDRRQLVCSWLCSKECALVCFEMCGLPPKEPAQLNLLGFAELTAKISSNREILGRLAGAVIERDESTFKAIIEKLGVEQYCHYICHWICSMRCRLICEIFYAPTKPLYLIGCTHLMEALQQASLAVARLLKEPATLAGVEKGVLAHDCDMVRSALERAEFQGICRWICHWVCSWRCVRVCLLLCRPFTPVPIEHELVEIQAFAKAVAVLETKPDLVEKLVNAVETENAAAYAELVKKLGYERFCHQLCHWLCRLSCRRFCRCVCPPIDTIPLFTHVGGYHVDPIYGEFQANGTTTAGAYAFTRVIPLIGILPGWESSNTYEYRFQIAKYPGLAIVDVDATMISPTVIGQLEFRYWNGLAWTTGSTNYYANNPGATYDIPQPPPALPKNVSVNTDVQAGGWIKVPHDNDLTDGGGGRFIPQGGLVNLITTKFTKESFDLTMPAPGLKAGDSIPAGIPPHSEKPTYKIFFEARKQGTFAPVWANNLDKIAFSNTAYKYVRHTEWDGGTFTTRSVCTLDIAEMIVSGSSGCGKQGDHIHALYTCYHPYLGSVLLWLQGPGIPTGLGIPPVPVPPAPFSFAPVIAIDEAASGLVGHDFDLSTLKPCAYVLWMSATVKLTEGWGQIGDATEWDMIAFCKGKE
ncbi:MAG: hypothetical protein HOP04_04045 [Methylophilaceae bacterium]|nr:hypothetical protein [Methylophilaceae bacterium]